MIDRNLVVPGNQISAMLTNLSKWNICSEFTSATNLVHLLLKLPSLYMSSEFKQSQMLV